MEKAVVFGCGKTAREYKNKITERFDVVAYASNHAVSWGKMVDGIEVIAPAQIPEDAAIVVASDQYYLEILDDLASKQPSQRVYTLTTPSQGGRVTLCNLNAPNKLMFEYPKHEVCPTILDLELSGACNSKCRYCMYHSEYGKSRNYKGFMSEDTLNELLRQIKSIDSLRTLSLVGGGEPMMHPNWQAFATRLLDTYGAFEECIIHTNGMILTKENAEKLKQLPVSKLSLRISIDGTSPEDCEYWRKGERFSTVCENVNRAYDILGGGTITFAVGGCVVLPASLNVDSAEQVEKFLKESGEWRKKAFPFAIHGNGLAFPVVEDIPGTKSVDARVFPKECSCENPFIAIAVQANGDIVSCHCGYIFRDEKAYRIGNIKKDQLMDVYRNNKTLQSMRTVMTNQEKPSECGRCAYLGGNRILCLQRTE